MPKRNNKRTIEDVREAGRNGKNDITTITLKKKENESETPIIKNGKIYLITNLINSKKYIGVTTRTLKERFKEHIYLSNKNSPWMINKAIKKYGHQNFKIELLEELNNITEKELLLKESFYIKCYNTFVDTKLGYNLVKYDNNHFFASEETKKKRSDSLMGEKNPRYGKHHTEESKKKISLARIGKWVGKDNPFYGKLHTEETRQKMKMNHITLSGKRHPNYDLSIRKFKNIKTGELFGGNRHEFMKKYNLKKLNVKQLISGRNKSLKEGWVLADA